MPATLTSDVRVTRHVRQRWAERFSEHAEHLTAAIARAQRVPFAKLRLWQPWRLWRENQEYYHDPATNALFVLNVDPDGVKTAITVIPVTVPAKTYRVRTSPRGDERSRPRRRREMIEIEE